MQIHMYIIRRFVIHHFPRFSPSEFPRPFLPLIQSGSSYDSIGYWHDFPMRLLNRYVSLSAANSDRPIGKMLRRMSFVYPVDLKNTALAMSSTAIVDTTSLLLI